MRSGKLVEGSQMIMKNTTPEETSETRKQKGTRAPSSGKVKVVVLLVGALGVPVLLLVLHLVIYRDALNKLDYLGYLAAVVAAVFFPVSYAVKIWKGPTLEDLGRVPFVAAFWGGIGGFLIYLRLSGPLDFSTEFFLPMNFILLVYLVVKKVMVWWLEMPELKDVRLSVDIERIFLMGYCILLSQFLFSVFGALVEASELYGIAIIWLGFLVSIALAVICYYVGRRALNLSRK